MRVAVIPARAGSKRIPRKNLRSFAGKPVLAYSIEACLESALFEQVVVSTDSEEIAEVARRCGAQVPFMRPPELADDFTGTDAVVVHALRTLVQEGRSYVQACCVYATAPFLEVADLREGLRLLEEHRCSSAFSVTTFAYPIFRALQRRPDGCVEMIWPEHANTRSNDLPEALHDAGQFYWVEVARFLESGSTWAADSRPVVLPRFRVQDLDTEEDWREAELKFELLRARKEALG